MNKILLTLTLFLSFKGIQAQETKYLTMVDSIVGNINSSIKLCDSTEFTAEKFLNETPDGGAKLTIYRCVDSKVKIVEWIGLSYGVRIRRFYSDRGELTYVEEEQFELIDDASSFRRIYKAEYYVKNGFYQIGGHEYPHEYNYEVEPPEPITYTMELVKQNKEYLKK